MRSTAAGVSRSRRAAAHRRIAPRALRRLALRALLSTLLVAVPGAARAVDAARWPQHAITIHAGNQAGSATDVVARLLAEALEAQFGVPVVVENRAGAGGRIAAEATAKAPANGYTLLVAGTSNLVLAPAFEPDLRYDPLRDFKPIGRLAQVPFGFAVGASVPANTLGELAALARREPGRLTYVSLGAATTTTSGMARFMREARVDLLGIEYRGIASAIPDVLAGRVDVVFTEVGALAQYAQGRNLRVLAIAAPRRAARLPQVPTTAEQGFPGVVVGSWYGLLAPAGTPTDVVKRLEDAYAAVVKSPAMRMRIDALGYEPVDDAPGQFGKVLRDEIAAARETLRHAAAPGR